MRTSNISTIQVHSVNDILAQIASNSCYFCCKKLAAKLAGHKYWSRSAKGVYWYRWRLLHPKAGDLFIQTTQDGLVWMACGIGEPELSEFDDQWVRVADEIFEEWQRDNE